LEIEGNFNMNFGPISSFNKWFEITTENEANEEYSGGRSGFVKLKIERNIKFNHALIIWVTGIYDLILYFRMMILTMLNPLDDGKIGKIVWGFIFEVLILIFHWFAYTDLYKYIKYNMGRSRSGWIHYQNKNIVLFLLNGIPFWTLIPLSFFIVFEIFT